jgi:hypothetical protein
MANQIHFQSASLAVAQDLLGSDATTTFSPPRAPDVCARDLIPKTKQARIILNTNAYILNNE